MVWCGDGGVVVVVSVVVVVVMVVYSVKIADNAVHNSYAPPPRAGLLHGDIFNSPPPFSLSFFSSRLLLVSTLSFILPSLCFWLTPSSPYLRRSNGNRCILPNPSSIFLIRGPEVSGLWF